MLSILISLHWCLAFYCPIYQALSFSRQHLIKYLWMINWMINSKSERINNTQVLYNYLVILESLQYTTVHCPYLTFHQSTVELDPDNISFKSNKNVTLTVPNILSVIVLDSSPVTMFIIWCPLSRAFLSSYQRQLMMAWSPGSS